MTRFPTSPADERRRPSRFGLVARLAVGCLAVVTGAVAVACSAGTDQSKGADAAAATTSTTAAPDTTAQTITQTLRLVEIAGGFDDPTSLVNRPMRNQLWIAERGGAIKVISIDTAWNVEAGVSIRSGFTTYPGAVLDISGEVDDADGRGILGIAFSTDAHTLFIDYVDRRGEIVVASWTITDPPPPTTTTTAPPPPPTPTPTQPGQSTTTTARPRPTTTTTTEPEPLKPIPVPIVDQGSRQVLLRIPHPNSGAFGGQLALGRDGYLYIGVGDTDATPGDRGDAAQDTESLLGKILRIDPGTPTLGGPYDIPSTNPYIDGGGAAQVFITGVHDPRHFSFDRSNGELWVGDPGTDRFQEITKLPAGDAAAGANLGWPLIEGTEELTGEVPDDVVAPLVAYRHVDGSACEIVGGYVYRGAQMADLRGVYLYGDRCGGAVRGLLQKKGEILDDRPLGASLPAGQLVGFGQDDQGELYVISASGSILRLAPT